MRGLRRDLNASFFLIGKSAVRKEEINHECCFSQLDHHYPLKTLHRAGDVERKERCFPPQPLTEAENREVTWLGPSRNCPAPQPHRAEGAIHMHFCHGNEAETTLCLSLPITAGLPSAGSCPAAALWSRPPTWGACLLPNRQPGGPGPRSPPLGQDPPGSLKFHVFG